MKENLHEEDKGLLVIIRHIIKWRWYIGGISLIAAVAAIIFSMPYFMPPKFKSTIVFYPASSASISKALLAQDLSGKQDALKFGEEEEAEQLLQILESDVIKNRVIEKYDLMRRYDIDQNDPYKYTELGEQYDANVSSRRNEHMAIEVTVYDQSPDTAAMMAQDIADLMDSVKKEIHKQRAGEALKIVAEEYKKKEKQIQILEDSLAALGKLGVINYEEQAAPISEALDLARADYYRALGEANGDSTTARVRAMQQRLETVRKEYDKLSRYGGIWLSVKEGLVLELEQYKLLKEKYEQAMVDVNSKMTFKYVTNYPRPAEKKSKPVRSLIVLISTLGAFVLATLLFVLYEVFESNKEWLLSAKQD